MSAPGDVERFIYRLARQIRDDDVVNVATPLTATAAFLAQATHARGATVMWHGEINPTPQGFRPPGAVGSWSPSGVAYYGQAEAVRLIEAGEVSLMFISPAQIDPAGRLNSSKVSGRALPGGIGTGDLVSLVGRIVGYKTGNSLRPLVNEVEYVTGRSDRNQPDRRGVTTLVASVGTIGFSDGVATLESKAAGVDLAVLETTAVEIGLADPLSEEPEPDEGILKLIDEIDPLRVSELEFGRLRADALARLGQE